jgi:hypothetical protein
MEIAGGCRDAMGIAAGAGAHGPAPRPLRCFRARTHRPTFYPGRPSFRLLFERELAVTAPHRESRCETASPSDVHPAFRVEAGSRRDALASVRSRPLPVSHHRFLDVGGNTRSGGGPARSSRSGLRLREAAAGAARARPSTATLRCSGRVHEGPPPGQNARLRGGVKIPWPYRERDRRAPVSRSTAPRQFPLHPYRRRKRREVPHSLTVRTRRFARLRPISRARQSLTTAL